MTTYTPSDSMADNLSAVEGTAGQAYEALYECTITRLLDFSFRLRVQTPKFLDRRYAAFFIGCTEFKGILLNDAKGYQMILRLQSGWSEPAALQRIQQRYDEICDQMEQLNDQSLQQLFRGLAPEHAYR